MSDIKYYYLIEYTPSSDAQYSGLSSLAKEFPGLSQVMTGSIEYDTYEECTEHCVLFLNSKLPFLNEDDSTKFKIFFEKNQFDTTQPSSGEWEVNEVVKIYISNSMQTVYNSLFKARIFFVNSIEDSAFYFDAPTTLQ